MFWKPLTLRFFWVFVHLFVLQPKIKLGSSFYKKMSAISIWGGKEKLTTSIFSSNNEPSGKIQMLHPASAVKQTPGLSPLSTGWGQPLSGVWRTEMELWFGEERFWMPVSSLLLTAWLTLDKLLSSMSTGMTTPSRAVLMDGIRCSAHSDICCQVGHTGSEALHDVIFPARGQDSGHSRQSFQISPGRSLNIVLAWKEPWPPSSLRIWNLGLL